MAGLDGFEEFVTVASSSLLKFGQALTGDTDGARDLVQEALTRMAERWDKQSFDAPTAYARTTMVRLNIDRFRRLRNEARAASLESCGAEQRYQPGSKEEGDWLLSALRYLSPNQRTALALRFVDEMEIDEIAQCMKCRPGTARSHLSRGIGRLRAASPTSIVVEE